MSLVLLDLALIVAGVLVFLLVRRSDTVTPWHLLLYPSYWIGGIALGHLILLGLKLLPMFEQISLDLITLFGVFWGAFLLYIWDKKLN